ncbi:MAG: DUF3570 domain-containing protein [Burkholderiaceae bacterium]|nr:DUF3570 domain-containing protein [Burkholderiaceae bacterium]
MRSTDLEADGPHLTQPRASSDAPARDGRVGAVVAAALALPGIAAAQNAPESAVLGLKYLYYKDYQPGLDRIEVNSPSLYLLTPLGRSWSVEGSLVVDSLSGATPRWHSSISSASRMEDHRTAGDLKITRYFRRAVMGLGVAYSTEDDYESRALSADVRLSTDDNNTTITLGTGYTDDLIKPNPGSSVARDEAKRSNDFIVGLTQVLTRNDIVQVNLTHARGRGFYSDPYKFLDRRPTERDQTALLLRWNRHFESVGGTLRTSWRSYRDSFDVRAGTLGLEWAQPIRTITVTPSVRLHTQSAASFYVDPIPGTDVPPVVSLDPPFYSADHRLSAFGAITAGIKVMVPLGRSWAIDAKADYYEQRGEWRVGGDGSPGLAPFKAHTNTQLSSSRL